MSRLPSLVLAGAVLTLALSGCFARSGNTASPGLTAKQMTYATDIARSEIAKLHSHIRLAVADLHSGEVQSSNTGHSCESGTLLRVTLIGSHFQTGTGGGGTVHAEVIEADPVTGQECLIGVKTGHVHPPAGATPIPGVARS